MPMAEDIILLAARAIRTFEATNEKDRYPHGHQQGKSVTVDRKPMNNAIHRATSSGSYIYRTLPWPFRQSLCTHFDEIRRLQDYNRRNF